jgi:hypothetical protein
MNIKAFSPTHMVSIAAGSTSLALADFIPYFFGHPLTSTAYLIINAVSLIAISYSNMKVGISASGADISKG